MLRPPTEAPRKAAPGPSFWEWSPPEQTPEEASAGPERQLQPKVRSALWRRDLSRIGAALPMPKPAWRTVQLPVNLEQPELHSCVHADGRPPLNLLQTAVKPMFQVDLPFAFAERDESSLPKFQSDVELPELQSIAEAPSWQDALASLMMAPTMPEQTAEGVEAAAAPAVDIGSCAPSLDASSDALLSGLSTSAPVRHRRVLIMLGAAPLACL